MANKDYYWEEKKSHSIRKYSLSIDDYTLVIMTPPTLNVASTIELWQRKNPAPVGDSSAVLKRKGVALSIGEAQEAAFSMLRKHLFEQQSQMLDTLSKAEKIQQGRVPIRFCKDE